VTIPHSRLPDFLILGSDTVKETSEFSLGPNYAQIIGELSLKKVERTAGAFSALGQDTSAFDSVTICNDSTGDLERLADDLEEALATLQEARRASGGPIAGPILELWNGSNDDDRAKLRATSIHAFALRQLAGQIRRSLASAKKDAEDKEAAVQVQESDDDDDMDVEMQVGNVACSR
jgi:hypothetical protein